MIDKSTGDGLVASGALLVAGVIDVMAYVLFFTGDIPAAPPGRLRLY